MDSPKVFISYSHDSPEHLDRVLALSNRLRSNGVDCRIDQYEQSPEEGWPLWCERQVEESKFVLVACTETYLRRFKNQERPNMGLGVTWEGHVITQQLYNAQGKNLKFIPTLFSKEDGQFIPLILQSATRYLLDRGYNDLLRRLVDKPAIVMPALGAMPELERKQDFQTVWNVPYPRNPFFTGREQILDDLRQALESRKCAALSGLGGMGKTQTAVEYAYRSRANYKVILWVRGETRDQLLADFASSAALLSLPSAGEKEQEKTLAEVKTWFEMNSGWLLILDNADDLGVAKEFLPRVSQGHVLMTTRARALGGLAERIFLIEMPPEEGALVTQAGMSYNEQRLWGERAIRAIAKVFP